MSENASMKIDIPGVDFGALARQAIAEKLTEALALPESAITALVTAALTRKVGSDGRVSQYHSENTTAWVEWVAQDLIRKATLDVVAAKLNHLRPVVERAVEAALRQSIKPAARALTETFIASTKQHYNVNVAVTFAERRG